MDFITLTAVADNRTIAVRRDTVRVIEEIRNEDEGPDEHLTAAVMLVDGTQFIVHGPVADILAQLKNDLISAPGE